MHALWYGLLTAMLIVYIVLDGFDFGAGIVYGYVAKTDAERRQVLGGIGPVWDGNEVWLIAAGGTLFFAFPKAYASGFSGFYLPLMILLWLLVLRGLAIELRSHEPYRLWHDFWDTTLQYASVLIAIVFGAAFGNLIRGVPLDGSGYFAIPLFANMLLHPSIGVVDYYTLTAAIFCVAVLAMHGALFLVWKTDGAVRDRSIRLARLLWLLVIAFGVLTMVLTWQVQPALFTSLVEKIWPLVFVVLSMFGFLSIPFALKRSRDLLPFLGSVMFLVGVLAATASALFPDLITSTINSAYSLTADNSAAGSHGLQIGLIWWTFGMMLVIGYFIFVYKNLSGKVSSEGSRE